MSGEILEFRRCKFQEEEGGGVNGFGCGNKVPELAESHAFWCPGFLAEVFVLTA